MKKTLFIALLAIFAWSCSRNDSSDDSSLIAGILPTKVSFIANGETFDYLYQYDGKKLTEIQILGDGKMMFEYSGDNISKITGFRQNGTKKFVDVYAYSNNKLLKKTTTKTAINGANSTNVVDYNWVDDNTLKGKTTINANFNVTEVDYLYNFIGGNLAKSKITQTSGNSSVIEESTYNYSSNHNPFRNIKGISVVLQGDAVGPWFQYCVNSPLQVDNKSTSNNGGSVNVNTDKVNYNLEFDTRKFPTKGVVRYTTSPSSFNEEKVAFTYNQ